MGLSEEAIVPELHISNGDRCLRNLTDIKQVSMNTWNKYNGLCSINCWMPYYVEYLVLKVDQVLHDRLHHIFLDYIGLCNLSHLYISNRIIKPSVKFNFQSHTFHLQLSYITSHAVDNNFQPNWLICCSCKTIVFRWIFIRSSHMIFFVLIITFIAILISIESI